MISIPFNFQPESVSVHTGSYTIPAGKYARVIAHINGNGSFTIDGATAIDATQASVVNVLVVNVGISPASYTVPSGYYFEGIAVATAAVTISVDGTDIGEISDTIGNKVMVGSGSTLSAPSSGISGTAKILGVSRKVSSGEGPVNSEFWLPSGTVINGSGSWRATVQIFNEIS